MHLSSLVVGAAALGALPGALAWGAAGHEIVATIAQIHLHPAVHTLVCSVLYPDAPLDADSAPCSLAPASTWADRYKYRMRWSAPLHYVGALGDHPGDTCVFPGARGWAGHAGANVLAAIRNVTTMLEDFVAGAGGGADTDRAEEALKFLIHFVGDMHQPLHLTGRDRGGNGDKVSWGGRVTNLHALWDGLLIAKALRGIPSSSNYSRPLPSRAVERALRGAIYDPYVRRLMWEGVGVGAGAGAARWTDELDAWLACPAGWRAWRAQTVFPAQDTDDAALCPYAWAQPIHQLNCELVWPAALDTAAPGAQEDAHEHAHGGCASGDEEMRALLGEDAHAEGRPGRNDYLELDTPEYAGRIEREWVVERLLAMGGIRLAGVLNGIFAPLVEDGASVPATWRR